MFALESPAVWLGHGYFQLVAAASSGLAESTAEGTAGGEILGQVAEPDETRQAITFLIVCLIGIALLLAALTVWYWHFTSPKRRASALLDDLGHYESDPRMAVPASAPAAPPVLAGAGGPSAAPDHMRLPAPAPAPAIDDRTTNTPAFASPEPVVAGQPAETLPETLPVAPPELPTNTPRRRGISGPEPEPEQPRRTPETTPQTPRRIEVAARASTNEPVDRDAAVAEDAEPIFADRIRKVSRAAAADPVPPTVETKTGTVTPRDTRASTASGAPTVTHRGPLAVPATPASTASPGTPRVTTQKQPAVASAQPAAERQPKKALSSSPTSQAAGTAGQEGLSDDDWAAVMQSAFSKLNK